MKRRLVIITGCIGLVLLVAAGVVFGLHLFTSPQADGEPSATPTPVQPAEDPLACIDKLPDTVKIGQKIMVAGYSDQLSAETPVLVAANVGGIIIMDTASGEQIASFKSAMAIAPFIAVDQEGGTVQRYPAVGILPGATEMARDYSTKQAYELYLADSKYLRSIGITTNFSPVVGVISRLPSPLPDRLYSSDPSVVVSYATQSIKAAQAAGITPVIKHFPGLGSATGNTDFGSATTDPLSILETRDLVPYRQLVSLQPDVMINNAIVPELTDGQPAVWSAAAVTLLRDMGYQKAVVYSDSLTANAIPGTLDEAALKAWQAGIDVALIVQERQDLPELAADIDAIIAKATTSLASGELNETVLAASVARIFERKGINPCDVVPAV